MAKHPITELMPPHEEKATVKGQVDKELKERVEAILDRKGWKWVDFLEASMKAFIRENDVPRGTSGRSPS